MAALTGRCRVVEEDTLAAHRIGFQTEQLGLIHHFAKAFNPLRRRYEALEQIAYLNRGMLFGQLNDLLSRFPTITVIEVDAEMRDLCENLVTVGIPLKTLLEAYTNGNP